jgi:cell division protein FtsB
MRFNYWLIPALAASLWAQEAEQSASAPAASSGSGKVTPQQVLMEIRALRAENQKLSQQIQDLQSTTEAQASAPAPQASSATASLNGGELKIQLVSPDAAPADTGFSIEWGATPQKKDEEKKGPGLNKLFRGLQGQKKSKETQEPNPQKLVNMKTRKEPEGPRSGYLLGWGQTVGTPGTLMDRFRVGQYTLVPVEGKKVKKWSAVTIELGGMIFSEDLDRSAAKPKSYLIGFERGEMGEWVGGGLQLQAGYYNNGKGSNFVSLGTWGQYLKVLRLEVNWNPLSSFSVGTGIHLTL